MKLNTVVVIVRHNTQLGGDIRLAVREFDALMDFKGKPVATREELQQVIGQDWITSVVQLSPDSSLVAMVYTDVDSTAIMRLLERSAFAQEAFLVEPDRKKRTSFIKSCSLPVHEVAELHEAGVIIALAQSYIIESEAVLDSSIMDGRIAATIDLLFSPYVLRKGTPKANRLRGAKKTTLSLSHDLHIYKAKFFPRMVRALLNIFGKDKAKVLDPFCGSGTALLEASLLGMDSFGCDIDPICQLISRTKVSPFVRKESLNQALRQFDERLVAGDAADLDFAFPEELRAKITRRDKKDETSYLGEIVSQTRQLASALSGMKRNHPEEELFFTLASDAVTKKIRYRFVGVGNGRYTIEIVRQPLLERMREKLHRSQQLAGVFNEITTTLNTKLGDVKVANGDARDRNTWPIKEGVDVIVTSPPYLPASSGREHYASSRALAFSMLGYQPGEEGYFDSAAYASTAEIEIAKYPEAHRLMTYLESDANENADPQRDAMRFERKAIPTRQYLADIKNFLESCAQTLAADGVLLLVVAHQHIFYSHRRQELEHVVSGRNLYAELAFAVGLDLVEEIPMELLKATTSKARPMAKDSYYETILVFKLKGNAGNAVAQTALAKHRGQ
jgi:SAM-dependent methyltransferase